MKPPNATYFGDRYLFHWPHLGVQVTLDRLREHDEHLYAMCKVEYEDPLEPSRSGVLAHGRVDCTSVTSQRTLVATLKDRKFDEETYNWQNIIGKACLLAIERWQEGEPFINLEDVAPREGSRWLLFPYLEREMPNTLFAFGGSTKSYLALAMAVSVASGVKLLGQAPTETGPVLYLDWESDEYTHRERLDAIKAGAGIEGRLQYPIIYRRQVASLDQAAERIRAEVAKQDVKLVIVDALGAARGGEVKNDDLTNRFFMAGRSLRRTLLVMDHLPKGKEADRDRPIGSIYTENQSRNMWRIEKTQEEGEGTVSVRLIHKKANNGMMQPQHGLRWHFENDHDGRPLVARVEVIDLMDEPKFRRNAPLHRQIEAILQVNNGPMTIAEIQDALEADGLQASEAAIRSILNRHKRLFVPIPDTRPTLWGLALRVVSKHD